MKTIDIIIEKKFKGLLIILKFNLYFWPYMQLNYQQARKFKNDHLYLKGRNFKFKDYDFCIDFLFIAPADRKKLSEFLRSVQKAGYIPVELEAGMLVPQIMPDFKDNIYDAHAVISTTNPVYSGHIVHRELSFILKELAIPFDENFYKNFK